MVYLYICLLLAVILLSVKLYSISQVIKVSSEQMDEIEKNPERNRQLKTISTDRQIEELLQRINGIYTARQQERIMYQRRETQIRREIENISHDLRTPLTSVLGYLELLQDEDTSEEEKKEYLSIIHKRARILQGFIQEFYEISRIEGDDYPILLEAVPVQATLREAAVSYYHEFERKKMKVSIELEEKQSFIIVDKIQFNRILNNLIQNVLKYANYQFIMKQFTVDNRCIIQFINDRVNMRDEELALIFDRFYTGDQSRTNQSTGLGLTITKLLVDKMKGIISARFEENMFMIELQWMDRV